MGKNKSLLFLTLYYFAFTIPQYIKDIYYIYDRVSIQILFISILNLIVFLSVIKSFDYKDFVKKINFKIHILSYFLVILFSSISLLITDNLVEGLIVLTRFATFFVAFILIVYIVFKSEINYIKYFFYFFISALFLETFAINYLAFDSVITDGNLLKRTNTFRGLTANINISSFSIVLKLPVVIYLIYKLKNNFKLVLLLSLITSSTLSVLILSSRGAIIAIAIVITISLLYFIIKEKTKCLLKSLLIILSLFLSTIFYNLINEKNTYNLIEDRFSSVNKPLQDQSINERLGYYKIAIEDIKSSPFLGVGIGNWKNTSILRANEFLAGYRIPYYVHNDFLEVAAESGILSGLSYLFFILFPVIVLLSRLLNTINNNLSFIPFACLVVFTFDSLINFPLARVVSMINLFFILTLFYVIEKNQKYNNEKYF